MSEALGQPRSDDDVFQQLRPELFGLAYRMLSIAAEAEDVVHEAYLRWRAQPRDDVRSPRAFLITVVTRLCLDALGSARPGVEIAWGRGCRSRCWWTSWARRGQASCPTRSPWRSWSSWRS